MTPRLWRLRQLIVSDLNTSTQTMFVLCFCAGFSCFEFCFHFWWWDLLQSMAVSPVLTCFWPAPHHSPLTSQYNRWYCRSQNNFEREMYLPGEIYISITRNSKKNFRLLISSAALANFVPPCGPFAQILQTSPSTFLLISIILRRVVTMQFFTSCA